MSIPIRKVNYLNNKDILQEIHKSKSSYCSFTKPEYHQYDIILHNISEINDTTLDEAKHNKAKRLYFENQNTRRVCTDTAKATQELTSAEIQNCEIIFRIMSYDHIPLQPGRKKNPKRESDKHVKLNFPPFQHWKFDENEELICVGKSHWRGDLLDGEYDLYNGKMTDNLARMIIKISERYATRGNLRSYCVDSETEALTKRGWLDINDINEDDTILSYSDGNLKWSSIKSIYRGEYEGLMHKLSCRGFDALVTPEHKMVTDRGLVKVELLKEVDHLILLGDAVEGAATPVNCDRLVELIGWIVTEGTYEKNSKGMPTAIRISQNAGPKADRIRNCLNELNYRFKENNRKCIGFRICVEHSKHILSILPNKQLTMDFILSLTSEQRLLLIDTMIDGDGWHVSHHRRYTQKSKHHIDLFQALCAMSSIRSNYHLRDHISFGKNVKFYTFNLFATKKNTTCVENINFHGGKNSGCGSTQLGNGKENHPNNPTTLYKGMVWCPETEYGCFVARRNGTVYLTGNTYNDEMRGQAILQLTQVGLQFDESKSDNPFSYFSTTISNSFVRVLNKEKRNQNIRDDILEMNGMNPSYTRTNSGEHDAALRRYSEDYE